jgi:peroxin-14
MRRLADALAKGLEGQKAATESRVRDLTSEVRSLKTLVAARVGGPNGIAAATNAPGGTPMATGSGAQRSATPTAASPSTTAPNGDGAKSPVANGASATASAGTSTTPEPAATPPAAAQAFPRFGSGKPAAIPAWQMAAAKKASQETLRKAEDGAERPLQAQVEEEATPGAA